MYYLLALVVMVILLVAGVNYSKNKASDSAKPDTVAVLSNTQHKFLNLKDIQKQLEVIAKTPPPMKLSLGAMCYEPVEPSNRMEYVCPVCSEKTIYSTGNQTSLSSQEKQNRQNVLFVLQRLEECHRLVSQIHNIG
jgi:hypothetical protein